MSLILSKLGRRDRIAAQQAKRASMSGKRFTAYAIISTLLEETAVGVIGFWLLPRYDIHLPVWLIILIMVGWAGYNVLTFRPSKRILDKQIPSPSEAMIGCEGTAKTRLNPDGMVQVEGALWKAIAKDSIIESGDPVVVVGIQRLTLSVAPLHPRALGGVGTDKEAMSGK